MTNVEAADKLKAIAEKYYIHEMKILNSFLDNDSGFSKEEADLLKKDKKDLIKLSTLIKNRAYEEAYDHMTSLDTIVREALTESVYKYILKKSGIVVKYYL